MVLFDLLGRRWAMGVIWNLHKGPCTFRRLQEQCESISPTVLNTRLKELRATGLVCMTPHGYGLSADGEDLYSHLAALGDWADIWTKKPTPLPLT
jgi:DNA-binding HxlR family transcriptional regulator